MRYKLSSFDLQVLFTNIGFGGIILVLYFYVWPLISKALFEINPERAEGTQEKMIYLVFVYLCVPVVSFFFWRKDKKLTAEIEKAQNLWKENIESEASKEKLTKLHRKRNLYRVGFRVALMFILFLLVFVWSKVSIEPLYQAMGEL